MAEIDQTHDRIDILFFCRGRGRGHAVRDLTIAARVQELAPSVQLAFASYGTGASVLGRSCHKVHDLGLAESHPFPDLVVASGRLIRKLSPKVVVAQEEFAALTAAAIFDTPSVFTTHWFPDVRSVRDHALMQATSVCFIEDPGMFEEPPSVAGRVRYCGPVLRQFRHHPSERQALRKSLGLHEEHAMVLVLPGSPSEEQAPLWDLAIKAFGLLKCSHKRLFWIAGADYDRLTILASSTKDVVVLKESNDIDTFLIAADVVLGKGTYNVLRESMVLGVPSICVTHHLNRIDDLYAKAWANNIHVSAHDASPLMFSHLLYGAIRGKRGEYRTELMQSPGATTVANIILTHYGDRAT